MGPDLSLCLLTGDPAATAARISVLRPHVDEIVVALDARAADGADLLHEADVCLVYEFAFPSSRNFAWLNAQCTGRWRLRLDADEVPSRSLLDALPELTASEDVTHYWLPRRWLYKDPDTWLRCAPWYPDYQLRLVRNLPAVDRPPRWTHDLAPVIGPGRYLETPIYHLDLLEQSYAARAAKAAGYEQSQPGLRTEGFALNAGFYAPERHDRLETAPVPEADRAVLRAADPAERRPAAGAGAHRPAVRVVTRAEIDARWPGRTLPESAYRARIEPFLPPSTVDTETPTNVYVRVTNDGDETWPGGTDFPEIRIGYRFVAPDGTVHDDGGRALLPAPVRPGAATIVPVPVAAPDRPGAWQLHVDLVHEHVRWFDAPLVLDVTVRRPRRIALLGGDSPFRHVGDDAIVRAHLQHLALFAPGSEAVLLARDPGAAAARFGATAVGDAYDALYAGIDEHRDPDDLGPAVSARIDELVGAAVRRREHGEPAADPAVERILAVLAGCEALVLASGGALTSAYAVAALWPHLATARVAAALGVPVYFSGVTVGPFAARDHALAAAAFGAAELIVTRDAGESAADLAGLGVDTDRVVEAPDPAVALVPAPVPAVDAALAASGIGSGAFAVVSLREGSDPAVVAAVADLVAHLHGLGVACLAVPHCIDPSGDDRRVHDAVAARVPTLRPLEPLPADDVIAGIVARAVLTCGTRYHLAVFAAAAGVPAIGFATDAYTTRRLRGAALAGPGPVTVLPATATSADVIAAADRALASGRMPEPSDALGATEPALPVIARLASGPPALRPADSE